MSTRATFMHAHTCALRIRTGFAHVQWSRVGVARYCARTSDITISTTRKPNDTPRVCDTLKTSLVGKTNCARSLKKWCGHGRTSRTVSDGPEQTDGRKDRRTDRRNYKVL